MEVNRQQALNWVNSPPSRWQRFCYGAQRVYHHVMPRLLDGPISLWGITSTLLQLVSTVGLFTSPFWIGLFLENTLPTWLAINASFAIVALRLLGWLAPKLRTMGKEHSSTRRQLDELATRQFNIVKELFAALPDDCLPKDDHWRFRMSDRIVSCILHLAKNSIGGSDAENLQCTFIGFEGPNADKLKIISRAKDIRPGSINTRSDQTIAYYVAESGRYFVVNDLLSQEIFPHRGLSHEKASYRSIMLIPVVIDLTSGKACVGVVTIDSPRPCEFWGDIGDSLATQLIPFVHILTFVMKSGYPTIPVQEA